MTQSEFNKKELIQKIINEAIEKDLDYKFVVEEFKRNKWNINMKQAAEIASSLGTNTDKVLFLAEDLNILNVDSKTKKAIQRQRRYFNKLNNEEI